MIVESLSISVAHEGPADLEGLLLGRRAVQRDGEAEVQAGIDACVVRQVGASDPWHGPQLPFDVLRFAAHRGDDRPANPRLTHQQSIGGLATASAPNRDGATGSPASASCRGCWV
jgi:hypothetical protein